MVTVPCYIWKIWKTRLLLLKIISQASNEIQMSNLHQSQSLWLQKFSKCICCCICKVSILVGDRYCYHSAFPTTRQHSLLSFSIPYYTSAFTATIQHSLLHASIHYCHSAFPTTLQHSQLRLSISYYTPALTAHSAFTTTLQYSLLP